MASITVAQILKINNACSNDWKLDTQYYIYHGEKQLVKCIELDEEHYLEFSLNYNYNNQISLHISKFYHKQGEEFASSNGLGKRAILEETQVKRKNINKLIDFTSQLDNNKLLEINQHTPVSKGYGIIMESEEF